MNKPRNKPKAGQVCAAKNCANKSYESKKSFFRFPKDSERARLWLLRSKREDLLELIYSDALYQSYRLCNDHFELNMFTNKSCNRLKINAVPTMFPLLESSNQHVEHSYVRPRLVHLNELETGELSPKIRILQDNIVTPAKSTPQATTSEQEDSNILRAALTRRKEASNIKSEGVVPLEIDVDSCDESSSPPPELISPSSSTQTSSALTSNTPRKVQFRKRLRAAMVENAALKKENEILEAKLKNVAETITLEQYQALTFKFCPNEDIANFINAQVSGFQKIEKGRRYSEQFKLHCLEIYFSGPKIYKQLLAKKYCLPGPQTLLKLIKTVATSPGLNNPYLFNALKVKANSFKNQDRYCVLCIDEMAIKANLFYNRNKDCVVGLAENEMKEKIFRPSLNACVLMLRGIQAKWKQPLAYYFCHTSCPADSILKIVLETVAKATALGLKVCAVTTDMGSNNIQMSTLLGVTRETPYIFVENKKIFYIFDIPHILKAIRNMLLKYKFFSDGKIISWDFVKMFYNHDKTYPVRGAPKLSESHINPNGFEKMKVKFAAQIFSANVSCSMNLYIRFGYLPSEAVYTSDFIDRMDKLFDILNSSQTSAEKKFNRAFKGLDYQIEFLEECLNFFNNIEIRNASGVTVTNKIKCIKNIQISIRSILSLWDFLSKECNFTYLFTRRLNQDALKNHFGKIRQQNGNCINPTAIQFHVTFRKLLFLSLFHSGTENCKADLDAALLKLNEIEIITEDEETRLVDSSSKQQTSDLISLDYQKHDVLENNFIRYICGYLCRKGLQIHSCDICSQYAKAHEELDDTSLYCYFKAYENADADIFGNLLMPHDDFVTLITNVEIIFQKNFEKVVIKPNVCSSFLELCQNIPFTHPCTKFPKSFIIRLYLRVRIYYTLKNINKNFKSRNKNKLIIWRN